MKASAKERVMYSISYRRLGDKTWTDWGAKFERKEEAVDHRYYLSRKYEDHVFVVDYEEEFE
jgi:hypothetical protein